jgi:fucokinase
MSARLRPAWDYLIVTASHEMQARAYNWHLRLRHELGLLPQVRRFLVVPDWEGRRIGSGGSTVCCLAQVLDREAESRGGSVSMEELLRPLNILIVHAGGDSRRLPAYAPCGKIFVPVPAPQSGLLPATLFDLLVPDLLDLPAGAPGRGQVVVAAGDALIRFDASHLRLDLPGITMLGCAVEPAEASRHGVYCLGPDGGLSRYLQKPAPAEQKAAGAVDASGKSALDLGVMSMDAAAAATLLGAFGGISAEDGRFRFGPLARETILRHGVDLYREICCALGSSATAAHYVRSARASGSTWSEDMLAAFYPRLRGIPVQVQLLPGCSFLHFGATRQLIESGQALLGQGSGGTLLALNNSLAAGGAIAGGDSWVEGCRLSAPLQLSGRNVVVGVDLDEPLSLAREACLDVVQGHDRRGATVWFVRCYGIGDGFKDSVPQGARFCGWPVLDWIAAVGASPLDIWSGEEDVAGRSLWNARVFPAEPAAAGFRRWLWIFAPQTATAADKQAFLAADRYSAAEIALMADQAEFHLRRIRIWAGEARRAPTADPKAAKVLALAESSFLETGAPVTS